MNLYRKYLSNFTISLVIILCSLAFTSCDIFTKPENNKNPDTGTVIGYVNTRFYDWQNGGVTGSSVVGATISIGNLTTKTIQYGYFILKNVPVGDNIKVTCTSSTCIPFQQVITVQKGKTTSADMTISSPHPTIFPSSEGQTLYEDGSSLTFPIEAFVRANGSTFSGNVLGKTRQTFHFGYEYPIPSYLPGNYRGVRTDGTEVDLDSYANMYVSVFDAADSVSELNLASGKACTFSSLRWQEYSGSTIPMWYYDFNRGVWREQGVANYADNHFTGAITRLGYWIFAQPLQAEQQSTITGRIGFCPLYSYNQFFPVNGALVTASVIDCGGSSSTYTDSEGRYSLRVKANARIKIKASLGFIRGEYPWNINSPAANTTSEVPEDMFLERTSRVMLKMKIQDTRQSRLAKHTFTNLTQPVAPPRYPFTCPSKMEQISIMLI